MTMKLYYTFILLSLVTLTSCSEESTSDLIDVPLVENVTYTNTVKSIIDNNCLGCHSDPMTNSAPMPLNTYEKVKEYGENGKLIDFISRTDETLMPLGGLRLPQPTIDLIIKWRDQGFQQ